LLIQYLVHSPGFAGIGTAKAEALWSALGDKLAPTLASGDVVALQAVLTPSMAQSLVDAWQARLPEAELMAFLDSHGFELRLANRLIQVWGDSALSMVQKNPYYMLAFAGWPTVDRAATKLGIKRDDPRRLVGAVESVLYERLQQAHTLTSHDALIHYLRAKLETGDGKRAIDLAVSELAVIGDASNGYQAFGVWSLERGIEKRIKAMLLGEVPEQGSLLADRGYADDWIEPVLDQVEQDQGFPLNEEQRAGAVMPFRHSVSLLTGGAGVGKTTVLRAILRLAQGKHLRVFQMALAGRAAKRMTESTGHPAMTIAKFLHDAKAGQITLAGDSLVVIDEASMLDLPTLYRILRFMPDGARLLLVGDPAQLPPIGFGLVFHRLVSSALVPATNLVQVHRQAESTGIPAVAAAIRRHEIPEIKLYEGKKPGVSFIACDTFDVVDVLRRLANEWSGEDFQVLSAVKGGFGGIEFINGVDSSPQLSQRTRPILSHGFVKEFGYSDVDKSTGISVS
jgi:exodeoxyribonuclease V alpha subunit